MTVKTDWKITDRYNVSDYNRMTENLTTTAGLAGVTLPSWPAVSYASITGLADICKQIIAAYNALRRYADGTWPAIAFADRWLLWSECNQIEGICADVEAAYGYHTHAYLSGYTFKDLAARTHANLNKGGM